MSELSWHPVTEPNGDRSEIVFRGKKSRLAGWLVESDGQWVARTVTGVRGEFEDEESARAFLTLMLSTGTNG